MTEKRKDLISAIFFLAFAVFVFVQSFHIRMSTADSLGPQFFPRIISIVMAALAAVQLARNIDGFKASDEEAAASGLSFNLPLILTVGLLIGYFLLLEKVGFIILTTVYLFCQIYLLLPKGSLANKKTLIISVAVALVMPTAIYMLFYHGFMIFLPPGILG